MAKKSWVWPLLLAAGVTLGGALHYIFADKKEDNPCFKKATEETYNNQNSTIKHLITGKHNETRATCSWIYALNNSSKKKIDGEFRAVSKYKIKEVLDDLSEQKELIEFYVSKGVSLDQIVSDSIKGIGHFGSFSIPLVKTTAQNWDRSQKTLEMLGFDTKEDHAYQRIALLANSPHKLDFLRFFADRGAKAKTTRKHNHPRARDNLYIHVAGGGEGFGAYGEDHFRDFNPLKLKHPLLYWDFGDLRITGLDIHPIIEQDYVKAVSNLTGKTPTNSDLLVAISNNDDDLDNKREIYSRKDFVTLAGHSGRPLKIFNNYRTSGLDYLTPEQIPFFAQFSRSSPNLHTALLKYMNLHNTTQTTQAESAQQTKPNWTWQDLRKALQVTHTDSTRLASGLERVIAEDKQIIAAGQKPQASFESALKRAQELAPYKTNLQQYTKQVREFYIQKKSPGIQENKPFTLYVAYGASLGLDLSDFLLTATYKEFITIKPGLTTRHVKTNPKDKCVAIFTSQNPQHQNPARFFSASSQVTRGKLTWQNYGNIFNKFCKSTSKGSANAYLNVATKIDDQLESQLGYTLQYTHLAQGFFNPESGMHMINLINCIDKEKFAKLTDSKRSEFVTNLINYAHKTLPQKHNRDWNDRRVTPAEKETQDMGFELMQLGIKIDQYDVMLREHGITLPLQIPAEFLKALKSVRAQGYKITVDDLVSYGSADCNYDFNAKSYLAAVKFASQYTSKDSILNPCSANKVNEFARQPRHLQTRYLNHIKRALGKSKISPKDFSKIIPSYLGTGQLNSCVAVFDTLNQGFGYQVTAKDLNLSEKEEGEIDLEETLCQSESNFKRLLTLSRLYNVKINFKPGDIKRLTQDTYDFKNYVDAKRDSYLLKPTRHSQRKTMSVFEFLGYVNHDNSDNPQE